MSRYIDADILMEQVTKKKPEVAKVRYTEGFNDAIMRVRSMIHSAPTADVVEVRHGEWVVDAYNGDEIVRIPYAVHEHNEPYCSLCGSYALLDGKEDYVPSNFCPRCGAKMDGERREENEG